MTTIDPCTNCTGSTEKSSESSKKTSEQPKNGQSTSEKSAGTCCGGEKPLRNVLDVDALSSCSWDQRLTCDMLFFIQNMSTRRFSLAEMEFIRFMNTRLSICPFALFDVFYQCNGDGTPPELPGTDPESGDNFVRIVLGSEVVARP